MKKSIVLLVFLVLLVSGAYAQTVLRDGIYMTQGSQDMYHIYNIPQYQGNIQLTAFAEGNFNNVMFHQAGYTVGRQLINVVFWISPYLSEFLPVGTQSIYIITNSTTFVDGSGQTWTWRRVMPR